MSKTIELDESKLPVGMVVGRYKDRIAELEARCSELEAALKSYSEREAESDQRSAKSTLQHDQN